MVIDTHSHLNFKAYDNDRNEVLKKTREAGVICIDVGVNFETSKNATKLAKDNENIYASMGLHPTEAKEGFDAEKYKQLAKSSNKIVAIGEVGLDYYYKPKGIAKKELFKEKQKQIFIAQLKTAQELNLPVIVHTRMAFNDTVEILKNYSLQNINYKLTGVIHCFVGTWQEAQKYLELGFYLGINGIIFKLNLDEVIKNCPLDKILVETDCPYLIPVPEGKDTRNEPIFVKHIIKKIADLQGLSFDQVAISTTQNAKKLFKIKNYEKI